ncbi:putative protein TPRXL [Zingiber officinale]|uniref:putative protein TPRXL n=1 Tax=Zingiber officinale TaxID=94328 RepID=UPI001C4B291A|nr:putative protein TPRXL [Zingiber officinale]
MEIMRQGRVILERRSLPHSTSTKVEINASTIPRPSRPPRASSTSQPASSVHPRASSISRPASYAHPRASPTSQPTSGPGRGHGQRSTNVTYASPAFREASQAARRARSETDRLSRDTPSSSRRQTRSPSDDSDSDDRPLAYKSRRRTTKPNQASGPSSAPHPSPPVATTTPIPSPSEAPPDPPVVPGGPPLAQPSISQRHRSIKAGPSHRLSPATSPPEPSSAPPSAPSSSAAEPSQPPPPAYHYCRTTTPSEVELRSKQDVPISTLTMKSHLATLWVESMNQMELLPLPAQMDRFSELYIRAAQLASQATELLAVRTELSQARATTEEVSTALTVYKEGENGRCKQSHDLYLRSPEFCAQAGQHFSASVIYGAAGALRQLYEQDYLKSAPPAEFLDHDRIIKEIPDDIFAPFK